MAVNDVEDNRDELDGAAEEIRQAGRRSVAITAGVSEPEEPWFGASPTSSGG